MYFYKTLDEISETIERINDELWPDGGQFDTGVTFEFNEYFGIFKFNGIDLIDTENKDGWDFDDALGDYEDIELCVRRLIKKLFTNDISQFIINSF